METDNEGVEPAVEYVPEALDVQPGMEAFSDVFARFQLPSESEAVSYLHISLPIITDVLLIFKGERD